MKLWFNRSNMAENFFLLRDEDIFSEWWGENAVPSPEEVTVYGPQTGEMENVANSLDDNWSIDVNFSESDLVNISDTLPVLDVNTISFLNDTDSTEPNLLPPPPPPSPEQPQGSVFGTLDQPLQGALSVNSVGTIPSKRTRPLTPIPEVRQPLKRLQPERLHQDTDVVSEFKICSIMTPNKKRRLETRMSGKENDRATTEVVHVVPEATLKSLSQNVATLGRLCKSITKYGSEIQTMKEHISVTCIEAECCNQGIKEIIKKMQNKVNNVMKK